MRCAWLSARLKAADCLQVGIATGFISGDRTEVLLDGLARCFAARPTIAGLTVGYAAPATRAELARGLRLLATVAARR
jgi:enoyl-CoA hydratase/carnithine racemase